MYDSGKTRVLALVLVLIVFSISCGLGAGPATPTSAPTATSNPPTATIPPSATPKPTATPNLAATQAMDDILTKIKGYVADGYLASDQGEVVDLDDASLTMAKLNYLDIQDTGYQHRVKDFVVWTDLTVDSAAVVNYPEYSGCGFMFRLQDNGDAYTAMVTKDRVLLTSCRSSHCYELGKTRGTGRLQYENEVKAHMELIVNDVSAYVLVDNQLIGEYSLSTDFMTDPGFFAYTIISGTNKDYGTRCEFKNSQLWLPNE